MSPGDGKRRRDRLHMTSLQVSAIIGSPFAGWLLGVSAFGLRGWQILFLTEALPAFLFGIILYFWLADWPHQARWLSEEEKQALATEYRRDLERKNTLRSYSVLEALRSPEVLKLCLVYFLWITGFWGFNYWMPSVLKEVSGWSTLNIGWAVVIPMSFSLAGMLFIGHSSARTGEKRWHGAMPLFLAAAGMGIGIFIQNPMVSLGFICLTAIGVYGAFGVWWSYPTTFLSGAAAAGAVGLINSFGNVGGYVGPYLTGVVRDRTGSFHLAYLALAFLLLVSAMLMLTLKKDRR